MSEAGGTAKQEKTADDEQPRGSKERRGRRFASDLVGPVVAFSLFVAVGLIVPVVSDSPFTFSFIPLVIVGIVGAIHVYLLLRVDLLSFASPAFMAIGGYTMALLAPTGITDIFLLSFLCFAIPAVIAIPIAVMALRLRGTYFVLLSFVLAEVGYLVIINWHSVLGGSNGISGIPAATFLSADLGVGAPLLRASAGIGALAVAVVGFVTVKWGRHLHATEENEELSQSLGARTWVYKGICFVTAAGVAGLAGLLLVNQLGNAHPESFHPFKSVDHVAYAVLGGSGSVLGPIIGATILVWLVNEFATRAEYAPLFYGIVLVVVILYARGGLVGLSQQLWRLVGSRLLRTSTAFDGKSALASVVRRESAAREGAVLEVDGLGKDFGGVRAVESVSFRLSPGEVLGIIGPNGAGKTTLINTIAGKERPSRGRVVLDGTDVTGQPSYAMNTHGIARSYQQTAVYGLTPVSENIARALAFSSQPAPTADIMDLLELLGLDTRLNDRAQDLPYGQQKMLGILMTLATNPRVVLLDEPAAGLERSERPRVDDLITRVTDRGYAVLLVEHDMDLVRRICPRVIVMDAGSVLADGPTEEVLRDPNVIAAYLGETSEGFDETDIEMPIGGDRDA